MDRKDLEDVALTVIVALCCPFAIFLPPFNKLLKENEDAVSDQTIKTGR